MSFKIYYIKYSSVTAIVEVKHKNVTMKYLNLHLIVMQNSKTLYHIYGISIIDHKSDYKISYNGTEIALRP